MRVKGIPCGFHPTTVMLVDDNEAFLESLKWPIERHSNCIAFFDPREALQYIGQHQEHPFVEHCVMQNEEDNPDERNLKVDLGRIHQQIFNPQRFNELSVVVVDYQMPGMNGIEFCKKIKDRDIRKIMLTGEADHAIAIEAFNEGIIDKFIKKDSEKNINQVVSEAIFEMQLKYFQGLSHVLIDSLIHSPEKPPACMEDPAFGGFFCDLLKQYNINEFYLLENQANFLMANQRGEVSWLVVRDAEDMQELLVLAQDLHYEEPTKESAEIIADIAAKRKVPFFYSKQDYAADIAQWGKYMHPLQRVICGNKTYYFAFIEGLQVYHIDQKRIVPFLKA